jgi:hypothetical protein
MRILRLQKDRAEEGEKLIDGDTGQEVDLGDVMVPQGP